MTTTYRKIKLLRDALIYADKMSKKTGDSVKILYVFDEGYLCVDPSFNTRDRSLIEGDTLKKFHHVLTLNYSAKDYISEL